MATRFLTEAELREDYGDAVITKLAAAHGGSGVVERKILDAEDEVLSFLRGFTGVPELPVETSRRLKVLVGALAYYNLYSHMAERPFTVRDGRVNAIKALSQIRAGELSITAAGAPSTDLALPAVAVRRRSPRDEEPISMASMRDWGHRT